LIFFSKSSKSRVIYEVTLEVKRTSILHTFVGVILDT